MKQTVEGTTKVVHATEDEIAVTFMRHDSDFLFTTTGEVDCPECGRIHTENEVIQVAMDNLEINWCPCGYIWLRHASTGQQIPLANHNSIIGLCIPAPTGTERDEVPHLRTLLRTSPGHSLGFNGGQDHLYYQPDSGTWVIDRAHTPPDHYSSFEAAWFMYKALTAPDWCTACGQADLGQTGEAPCEICGLPTIWDAPSRSRDLKGGSHND